MKIAAFVNATGDLVGLHENGHIQIFEYQSESWVKIKEIPLSLDTGMSLPEIHKALGSAVEQFEGASAIITGPLKGASLAMLQDLRLSVWATTSMLVPEMFDMMATRKELESIPIPQKSEPVKPEPVPVKEIQKGILQINLQEVMKCGSSHPSRTILIPVLEKRAFQKLIVICDHKPRWIDGELERLHLRMEMENPNSTGENRMFIYPETKS